MYRGGYVRADTRVSVSVSVHQVVYRKQRQCCVSCGDQGAVSLPCGHGLQCDGCSASAKCPLCSKETLDQQQQQQLS